MKKKRMLISILAAIALPLCGCESQEGNLPDIQPIVSETVSVNVELPETDEGDSGREEDVPEDEEDEHDEASDPGMTEQTE